MIRLVREARAAVLGGRYSEFRTRFLERFASGETLAPVGA